MEPRRQPFCKTSVRHTPWCWTTRSLWENVVTTNPPPRPVWAHDRCRTSLSLCDATVCAWLVHVKGRQAGGSTRHCTSFLFIQFLNLQMLVRTQVFYRILWMYVNIRRCTSLRPGNKKHTETLPMPYLKANQRVRRFLLWTLNVYITQCFSTYKYSIYIFFLLFYPRCIYK